MVHIVGVPDCRIVLITGERQVGKSTALQDTVKGLRSAGLHVSGLLTRRTGPHDLEVLELHTETSYLLTDPFTSAHTSVTRNFAMNADALLRSSKALETSFPTDVFVLDEIGPLELVHRQGWVSAFELLRQEVYKLAYLIVRPELLGAAVMELPGSGFGVIRVTLANRNIVADRLLHVALSGKARAPGSMGSAKSSLAGSAKSSLAGSAKSSLADSAKSSLADSAKSHEEGVV